VTATTIIATIALGAASLSAQAYADLLLPNFRHIEGLVVDPEGNPIVEAGIDHSGDTRRAHLTDSEGKFQLDTRAPALVVRKAGFRSELLRAQGAGSIRVTLQRLNRGAALPSCSKKERYVGIDGWGSSFQFPIIPGVKAAKQGHDIDYGARNYYLETKSGPRGIKHGSGPMWGFGTPMDREVWRSVTYEETSYESARIAIIDARGKLPNGNWWRSLGQFGESAAYYDVDENSAHILDQMLDGACLKL
jgi:hypothetical protein